MKTIFLSLLLLSIFFSTFSYAEEGCGEVSEGQSRGPELSLDFLRNLLREFEKDAEKEKGICSDPINFLPYHVIVVPQGDYLDDSFYEL